ncbi:glycosyltransferase family 4 protein [Pseudomonas sp. PDM04]|uniref:glycosyltransferase family 4 protein n=1 Tax=Pseudomonas sp. PDM04 TaxID=2769296 RepID=UPI00177E7248|nr:glycosyltransferase family 4 protein [Pseudomonas sp. PDM04]MBD9438181.1 glycosyltransferase family 4 protein [Pseudomonas sp. PDM04]
MRIAYFINQYPKVSHSFIRREILALERQGFEVQRIALRGWDAELVDAEDVSERDKTRYVLQGGVKELLMPVLQVLRERPRAFFSALWLALRMGRRADRAWPYHLIYLAEACRLLPWLQAFGAEHVHAHFGTNSTEVVMLANALGGPAYSFTVHGPEEFDKPQFIHLGEKVRRSAFVAAISSYGRSQLYRWVDHGHWAKVKVVHCGLERAFHEVPAVPVPSVPRLVCVGRLCEQKGQLLLMEAARLLAVKGVAFEMVLAGDGEMRGQIEALITQHGLQAHVRITGWISSEQVRAEMLAARAMVLPSFAEGLPVVIMEAMALRRPVLTTFVAGIPELVRQGENGWLFPAGAVEELADALQDCLAQPVEVLQRMGEAAYQRVLVRHDIDTEAARLAALFKAQA